MPTTDLLTRYLLGLLLALGGISAWGQPRPVGKPRVAIKASAPVSQGSISVTFVPVTGGPTMSSFPQGQGTLQLGEVSAGTGARTGGVTVERRPGSMVVHSSFGVRLNNPGVPSGSASLSAFLYHPDARCDISMDGIPLTTATRLIQGSIHFGEVTSHRLEIAVPRSVSQDQGAIANTIGFLAVQN